MIDLQTQRSKAPTRILSDIATENSLKFLLVGAVDENIKEADFNRVIWMPLDKTFVNGTEKSLPAPVTWSYFKQRLDEYLSMLEYKYNRRNEYPSIEEQLDTIFHEGLDVWKEQIQAIKDKYPKPE
mgnify:CR=1 FL=1